MRKLLLPALLLVLSFSAFGGPCVPGTLNDYLSDYLGCQFNGVLFQNFFLVEGPNFATPIDPLSVQVTPSGVGQATLLLTLNSVAGPGEVFDLSFAFDATGSIFGVSIGLGNPLAFGDGNVTGILEVCADGSGGFFYPGAECDGTAGTAIVYADDFGSLLKESLPLPGSFFQVLVDITVDGGTAGFASLDSAEVTLTPEPSTILFLTTGLLGVWMYKTRRQRGAQ